MVTAVAYLAYGLIAACTLFCVGAVIGYHVAEVRRDLKARRRPYRLHVVDDRAVRRIGGGTP